MAQATFLAVLGICAFSLQGCGKEEEVEDNTAAYATAAAGAGAGKTAKAMQEAGACPPFLSAIEAYKTEFLEELVPDITSSISCNASHPVYGTNFTSELCKSDIVEHLADLTLYYVEKDPGFMAWTKVEANVEKWKKIKEGKILLSLRDIYKAPAATLQQYSATKIAEGTEMGSAEFDEWLGEQAWQLISATLGVFCPALESEVAASEAVDAGSVAAQKISDANGDAAKAASAVNEANGEGLDASGASTSPGSPASTVVPSTSAVPSNTPVPVATTPTTEQPITTNGRRLVDLLQV
jgi:hypothetical protein